MDKDKKISEDEVAITYEASIRYLVEKSNKRAWLVAFVSIFVACLSILALALLMPLKSVEPYVIRVDNVTGMVDIITSSKEEVVSQNEALDKHFVSGYVKTRECYYYDILQQDYVKTQIFSSPEVAASYIEIYEGKDSRVERLKDKEDVEIHINSVVLGSSAGVKTATIRFNSIRRDKQTRIGVTTTKVATLSYDYFPDAQVSEEERLTNPLGFKVLTYRLDEEIVRKVKGV